MSILGIKTENDEQRDRILFWPAVLNEEEEMSLTKAIFLSAIIHVLGSAIVITVVAIVLFILQILGLNLDLFKKPEPQMKDIEFVLVNKEAKPINPKTKYRADKNSRAGGKHDPKKMVATPTAPTKKSAPQKKQSSQQKKQPNKVQKKLDKLLPKKRPEPQQVQKQIKKQSSNPKASSAPPRPAPQVSMPKPALPNAFSIPIPKSTLPKTLSGGGGSKGTSNPMGTKGSTGGSSSPAPVMSSGGASGKGRHSSPYSVGSGSLGNPGPGNPNGSPGVDAIAEPDFGPWMRDLQAKIKRNWDPPKSDNSKRVVLIFTIAKDGRLLHVRVLKSSGIPSADRAAISAVEYSAPFRPLPKEFRGSDIDINFTFDYNVFGGNIR